MKMAILFLFCCFLLVSCAPPPPDVAQVRKYIEELTKKAEKEMLAGTMDTTLAQYTDDAVSMPDHEPIVKGKGALKEYFHQMMKSGVKFTKVSFTTTDVQVSGSFAFEIGTFAMTMQMPGMPEISEEGKYLTVYEHAPDGSWKIKVETWNTNVPPPMPKQGT
jgi:ketosteroid isomerase-like protein